MDRAIKIGSLTAPRIALVVTTAIAGLSLASFVATAEPRAEASFQSAQEALAKGKVEKAIKQRKEAIAQFSAGGRNDLVEKETAEIAVLTPYLPAQMSDAEVDAVLAAAVAEVAATGVTGNAAMGKVMAIVKPKLAGKADMTEVSRLVKSRLGN